MDHSCQIWNLFGKNEVFEACFTLTHFHDLCINTSLPAAGRSLVGGRITNEDVKPYRKVNSIVALKFHPEVLSFYFSCVTKFILEIE